MDVVVAGSEGLPPKAYISIRAGDTRRQAPITSKEVFRFPSGGYKCMTVDVFEKLGSKQIALVGEADGESQQRLEQISFGRPDGSKIGLSLQMELHDPKQPVKPKPKASHQEAALKAKNYLEDHGVQKLLQDMVHTLLSKRPDDPIGFMHDFIGACKGGKVPPGKPTELDPVPLKAAPPAQGPSPVASVEVVVQGLGAEELPGFPVDECPEEMPDITSHFSIMAELLKKDPSIYSSLKGIRTKMGVTFAKVIKPGMDNRGHRMIKTAGVYAGDAESYSTFGLLFNPILSGRYGAAPAGGAQPLDLDYFKVSPAAIDPEGKYVVSVQARLNRNLAGMRFPPACSLDERREVERIMAAALLELTGELQGDYLPLQGSASFAARPSGMDASEEAELEAMGALFQEPDSTIALSSGIGRHWPDARGVFIADSGSLWAWLNEEDHLRLTSYQEGSDIRAAFARLSLAEGVLRQALQQAGHSFAACKQFGYLASSPANAGTSFTASISVRLPLLAKQSGFRQICSKLKLMAQHTREGVWAISNSEKFGLSEVELVQKVMVGCCALVERERKLELGGDVQHELRFEVGSAEPEDEDEDEDETDEEEEDDVMETGMPPGLGSEEYPGFSPVECPEKMPDLSRNFSLMTDVLKQDPSVYYALKDRKTKFGVPFAKVIKVGVDVPGHVMIKSIGVTAGDEHCYEVFKEVFDQVISLRHGGFGADSRQTTVLDPLRVDDAPIDPTGRIVLSARISATRNLKGFRLPPACSFDERREVERVITEALYTLTGHLEGDYHPLPGSESYPGKPESMTEEHEEWLREKKVLFQEPDSAVLLAAGVGRDWPDARGVFASEQADFTAWVNEEDHLRLFVNEKGPRVVEAFARLCRAHESLEAALTQQGHSFMKDERLGFLSSCPSNLGSGLRASISVSVPHLTDTHKLKDVCRTLQISARALGDAHTCWELSSNLGLGASEVDIVNSIVSGCRFIVELEQALGRGESFSLPGLGPVATPGFAVDCCPAVMPTLSGHQNHLAKVLRTSPCIYDELRMERTASGVTFAQVIKPGLDIRAASKEALPFGMVAGDAESYRAFARAFDPCIQAYHGLSPSGPHPCVLDPAAVEGGVVGSPGQVLSLRIRMSRNLGGVRMPSACSFDERREVERAVVGALSMLTGSLQGDYNPLSGSQSYPAKPKGMSGEEQKRLKAEGLLFQEPKSLAALAAGIGRDWPDARGVFASEDRHFAAWVNDEEHVTLVSSRKDGDLKAAFASICAAEKSLGLALQQDGYSFARCDHLGYITGMPERLGTGLSINVTLRLPLMAAGASLLQLVAEHGLKVVGFGRGGVVEVASKATLGVSEADLVSQTAAACARLLEAEG